MIRSHLLLFARRFGPHHIDVGLGELFVEEIGVLNELGKHRVGHRGLMKKAEEDKAKIKNKPEGVRKSAEEYEMRRDKDFRG